jgi:putative Holliday junction resolvase
MPETILAFDYGQRRIGVAVGQDVTASASPVDTVANGDDGVDYGHLNKIVAEWNPTRLVVGMPLHADGSPSEMSAVGSRGRISKADIDVAAAVCIAERYLAGG